MHTAMTRGRLLQLGRVHAPTQTRPGSRFDSGAMRQSRLRSANWHRRFGTNLSFAKLVNVDCVTFTGPLTNLDRPWAA
jgi:hypothetical protein